MVIQITTDFRYITILEISHTCALSIRMFFDLQGNSGGDYAECFILFTLISSIMSSLVLQPTTRFSSPRVDPLPAVGTRGFV